MEKKEIYVDLPINEKEDYESIKEIFSKHQAFYPANALPLEIVLKEAYGKEYIIHEMMKKEYIRKVKKGVYYDLKMESEGFRLHLKIIRFMIIVMFIVYVVLMAGLISGIIEGLR